MDILSDWVDTSYNGVGDPDDARSRADTVLGLQIIMGFFGSDLDAAGIPPPEEFSPPGPETIKETSK